MKKIALLLVLCIALASMLIVPCLAEGFDTEVAAAGGVGLVLIILAAVLALIIYFLPTIIAVKRKPSTKVAAILINIFLGETVIGWIIALVLALKKKSN